MNPAGRYCCVFSLDKPLRGRRCSTESVAKEKPGSLQIFYDAVSVMLRDGELTPEEKRLIVKLASLLGLKEDEPKLVYEAIVEGKSLKKGRELPRQEQLDLYEQMFELAFLNASISEDEYFVIAHLRYSFNISDEEHDEISNRLQQHLENNLPANMLAKVRNSLSESVDLVGKMFDSLRTKSN
jgi:uncharacterized tellurite resistance protein B-like protein